MNLENLPNLIKDCYLLPWSSSDNPNGWIEPTTYCQLKCPGCYRGLDRKGKTVHEELKKMKRHVDSLLKLRNVQTISIAGGEPLLYPKLPELLSYINSKGLKIKIFTNGLILDESMLQKLKGCGATEFIIHINNYQGREGYQSEKELNKLRKKYCKIFREVGDVNLGFIQPFGRNNLSDIPDILKFYKDNADIVGLIVFTIYSDVNWDNSIKSKIDTNITIRDVASEIQKKFSYHPCAYLGSNIDPLDPTWLFSISVGFKNLPLGFFDGKLYSSIQLRYRKFTRKYLFTKKGNKISLPQLIGLFKYNSIRKILKKYIVNVLRNPWRFRESLYLQTLLILRGPKFSKNGKRNLCEGCPDAMFYKEKLVPSCILEEIKLAQINKSK